MSSGLEGRSALIVEHRLEDLQALRAVIATLGFTQVQVASSVNMALSLLRERSVDICFVSYDLGQNEKNGLQLLHELQVEGQRRYQSCFVLVVEPEKSELLFGSPENAPDTYISKPYDAARIRQRLEKVLRVKASIKPVEVLLDQGNWDEALAVSIKLAQLYPGLKIYLERLRGLVLIQLGRFPEAYKLFNELLKLRDENWIRVALAISAYGCGEFNEAKQQLEHVLNRQQVCVEAFVWRSRVHRIWGEWDAAVSLMRRAVMLQPTVSLLQTDLGNLAAYNEEWALAAEALRAAIRYARNTGFQTPDTYFALVHALLKQVKSGAGLDPAHEAGAIRVIEEAQRDFLDEPVIQFKTRLLASEIYRVAGNKQRSESMASAAVELFKKLEVDDQAMWIEQLVDTTEDTLVSDDVREYRQQLTRQMATLSWGRSNLRGMMFYRNGDLEGALTQFKAALIERSENSSVGLNLVQAALELCRRSKDGQIQNWMYDSDETLYSIQFAALTHRQQGRYKTLTERLTDQVKKLA